MQEGLGGVGLAGTHLLFLFPNRSSIRAPITAGHWAWEAKANGQERMSREGFWPLHLLLPTPVVSLCQRSLPPGSHPRSSCLGLDS